MIIHYIKVIIYNLLAFIRSLRHYHLYSFRTHTHIAINADELLIQQRPLRRYFTFGTKEKYSHLDLIITYLAIENYYGKNDFGFDFYAKMQDGRFGCVISQESVANLRKLIEDFEKNGYHDTTDIVLDKNLNIIGYSYRLALALYFNQREVPCIIITRVSYAYLGVRWLRRIGFCEKEIKIITDYYDILLRNSMNRASKSREIRKKLDALSSSQKGQKFYRYQSFPRLGIVGKRPTEIRLKEYDLFNYLNKDTRVLNIGCNCGFFDLTISEYVKSVLGIEYNKNLVDLGNYAAQELKIKNCTFVSADFNEWASSCYEKFDLILSFAVHHWLGVTPERYVETLSQLLNPGGIVFLESHDVKRRDFDFEKKYINVFNKAGFQIIKSGFIMDDGVTLRKYYAMKVA